MTRVCEACARIWPPTGFFGSETNDICAPGSDVIFQKGFNLSPFQPRSRDAR